MEGYNGGKGIRDGKVERGNSEVEEEMKVRVIVFVSFLGLVGLYCGSLPDNKARVVFCDVGQGDGMLLIKNSFQMLVDTGPSNKKILGCLERYIPFWDKEIDVVMISHWDKDHSGGLGDVVKNYKINKIYSSNEKQGLIEQNVYSEKLIENDVVKIGKISFEVLNSGGDGIESNVGSLVGILNYKGTKVLTTGDAPKEVENRLVWQNKLEGIDVLKVSHHGSNTATSDELLDNIKPKVAVVSVGKNGYGHPTKEVLGRLEKRGIEIKRTDEKGAVIIVLD